MITLDKLIFFNNDSDLGTISKGDRMSHPVTNVTKKSSISSQQSQQNTSQDVKILQATIKDLKNALKKEAYEAISAERVRREIFQIANLHPVPPKWTIEPQKKSGSGPGVPTILISDIHHGEVVDNNQVGGLNSYNMAIARSRMKILTERTIDLLTNHVVDPHYPGIVVALGGDNISGSIHEELIETNEKPVMSVILDIFNIFIVLLSKLADTFNRVFIPAVVGNHSRTTHKWQYKNTVYSNYDWLIYQLLAKYFENDRRFTFFIGDGSDVYYRIFDHVYLLNHGNQFYGGDGISGPLNVIIRGDYKKRSRNLEVGQGYMTLVHGHWHTYFHLSRIIGNGSVKGIDEYAYGRNFPYEPPQQALWLTSPKYGITISMPVLLEAKKSQSQSSWISIGK